MPEPVVTAAAARQPQVRFGVEEEEEREGRKVEEEEEEEEEGC